MISPRSCFVIMPIGNQVFNGITVSSEDLRKRYDDLIKEAILKANSNLEVVRADDISIPGTITSDILTRIMHSDIVIADVTYPNPNVFYELGLRHACRPGTIIIRDKNGPSIPFDIAHLRHIEYENTPSGLKKLAEDFNTNFSHFSKDPARPDNLLLELAKLTEYQFQSYSKQVEDPQETQFNAILSILQNPEVLDMLMRQAGGENVTQEELIKTLLKNPDTSIPLLKAMYKTGDISLNTQKPPKAQFQKGKLRQKRKK